MATSPNITKIDITEFKYYVEDLGQTSGVQATYTPGGRNLQHRFALRIHTDAGVTGEYIPARGRTGPVLAQVEFLIPLLLGRPALERERLYLEMRMATRHLDGTGIGPLDVCLWDLAGKHHGASIAQLLGGWRTRMPVYVSTIAGDRNGGLDSPAAYADYAEQCRALGYRAFKLHIWQHFEVREVVETVLAVRKRVPDMDLMIDPAGHLMTFADVVKVGRACDEAGFFWMEDPLCPGGFSIHAHRKLRETIRTPLLLTEHIRTPEGRTDFVAHGGTDFVRTDPDYDGGITGSLKDAAMAAGFGLDIEVHCAGPAQRQLVAAIRNTNYLEGGLSHPKCRTVNPPVYLDGYSDELDAIDADGCLPIPDGPGLGVRYDWVAIEKMATDKRAFEAGTDHNRPFV